MCNIKTLEKIEKVITKNSEKLDAYFQAEKIIHATKSVAWYLQDLEGKIIRCNQATCDFFFDGIESEKIFMKNPEQILKEFTFKNVQTFVDTNSILLNSDKICLHFYEKLFDSNDNSYWVHLCKELIPPRKDTDDIYGVYTTAIKIPIDNKILENSNILNNTQKISDTIFLIKD